MLRKILILGIILIRNELEDIVVVEEIVEHGTLRGSYLFELIFFVFSP